MGALDDYIQNGNRVPAQNEPNTAPVGLHIQPIDAVTLAEMTFAPLVEPVQGLIVEGLTLLCGASKIGKSWFVLQMCSAVARGVPFLGRRTAPGPVLYLAYEDSERRLQRRLRQLNEPSDIRLQFDTKPIMAAAGLIDAMERWTKDNPGAKLIVIDTMQKVRGAIPARASMYGADYDFTTPFKDFAYRNHVAVVLVHHLNKLKDVEDKYDKISGSTGLMGCADTTIIIDRKRGADTATLSYEGRDVWGDDIDMRFDDGRWFVCGAEDMERERFERASVVQAVRRFTAQESFTGVYPVSYEDFWNWALGEGFRIGANARAIQPSISEFAAAFEKIDGLTFNHGKRIGSKRGMVIVKAGMADGKRTIVGGEYRPDSDNCPAISAAVQS